MQKNDEKKEEIHKSFKEKNVFGFSQKEVDELSFRAKQNFKELKKVWRQKGGWLICKNCEHPIGIWIGMEMVMTGEKDDGTPILEKKPSLQKLQ